MPYTETKVRNNRKYYYRTRSVRDGARVTKQRKYLGADLGRKELAIAERNADRVLGVPGAMLTEQNFFFLDRVKLEHARLPPETFQDRYESFAALFTHNSTAIGGNTLTLQETGRLLFEDIAPAGKPFREICEVIGHRRALDRILEHDGVITKELICEIHALVMMEAISPNFPVEVGHYRSVPVNVGGLEWAPPEPGMVPQEMKKLIAWHSKNRGRIDPMVLAARFHADFETVRPFTDGNGRVSRLLMNHILHDGGYPMVSIPYVLKSRYHEALEKARDGGDPRPLVEFILELLEEDRPEF